MKFLAALMLIGSLNALADSTIHDPKKMTCGELKELVENYKVITVRTGGIFNWSYGPLYDSDKLSVCDSNWYWPWPRAASFKTKDVKNCKVGYTCEARQRF